MTTLDDKLLGEKLHNYCSSSSEDEQDENDEKERPKKSSRPKFIPESEIKETNPNWTGSSQNTGPKGVIKDWQRFKQLQNEKNKESQTEREKIIKRLAMTCKSDDIDNEMKNENISKSVNPAKDADIDDLDMNDGFFEEYMRKKIEEMQNKVLTLPRFGKVVELTSDCFLNEIDNEDKNVTIFVHIYDQKMAECKIMNECLEAIAKDYLIIKICKIRSCDINISEKFRKMGCPALLIYKNKEMIGNFVKMSDEFGDEFCSSDVENFLIEQGFLPSQEVPSIIRQSISSKKEQDDSDD